MTTIPKIIKFASGEAIYANQALVKFIKAAISQSSGVLKPEDNIFFFKDVKFKRERLSVAQEKFQRVILIEKATAVVINTDFQIPTKALPLVSNKITDSDPLLADDIVYEISRFGNNYVETMTQWLKLATLTHAPTIVFETNLLEQINSGFVIDESNIDYLNDLLTSDSSMACQIIDSCDIEKSLPYIVWLVFFKEGILHRSYKILGNCREVEKYFSSRGMRDALSPTRIKELLQVPVLKQKISVAIIESLNQKCVLPPVLSSLVNDVIIDIHWKQEEVQTETTTI